MLFSLLFLAAAAEPRLAPSIRPTAYDMTLTVDPQQPRFSGHETITLKITDVAPEIHLHALGLDIEALTIEHAGKPVPAAHRKSGQELVITPAQPLPPGEYSLHATWSGPLDGNKLRGLYRFQSAGTWYVGSTFEATDARRMAPCFDEPAFKAPFTLTLRVPKALVAVSNGAVESEALDGDKTVKDMRDVKFFTTPALSTYLWAVMVGPFAVTDGGKFGHTPVRIITSKDKAAIAPATAKIVRDAGAALEKYFDMPFPFAKLDIIALPEFGSGAMENAGAIAGRESTLLLPANGGSRDEKREVAMVITHEMAHQWFGDLVTMAWWDDLWLNESFAEWLGLTLADRIDPELGVRFWLARGKHRGLVADALPSTHPIRVAVATAEEARGNFDVITYQKGAAILAMIQSWLGDDNFRAGLHRYLTAHANANATALDLFSAMSDASGKDVSGVVSGWLSQPGFPVLNGKVACTGKPTLSLKQAPYALLGQPAATTTWRVPVCARDADGISCGIVGPEGLDLPLKGAKCPAWLAPNAYGVGFFAYTIKDNPALARGVTQLFPEERFDYAVNQWALVESGVQSAGDFMQALAPLRGERHPLALDGELTALGGLRRALVSESTRVAFNKLVAAHFAALAKTLGWVARANENALEQEARADALIAMGVAAEDPETIAAATTYARKWLADPNSVPADTSDTALAIFSRHATVADIATIATLLSDGRDPQRHYRLVGALAMSHDPAAQQAGLALLLGDHGVRTQDFQTTLYAASSDAVAVAPLWQWVKAHFSEMTKDMSPLSAAYMPLLAANFCTKEAHADVERFFTAHTLPMMKPRLAEALARIDTCVALRAAEGPGFAAALDKALGLTQTLSH